MIRSLSRSQGLGFPRVFFYDVSVKAAAILLLFCVTALADMTAALKAWDRQDYATALTELLPLAKGRESGRPGKAR